MHGFHFDTCQMPVNVMDNSFRSFQRQVLPILVKEGIAPAGDEDLCRPCVLDEVLRSRRRRRIELLHLSMTRPVSVVITGMDKMEILDQALEAVRTFKPMTPEQAKALIETNPAGGAHRHV